MIRRVPILDVTPTMGPDGGRQPSRNPRLAAALGLRPEASSLPTPAFVHGNTSVGDIGGAVSGDLGAHAPSPETHVSLTLGSTPP